MNSKMKEILQALIDDEHIEFATVGNWATSTTANTLSVLRQWSFGHTSVSLRIKPQAVQLDVQRLTKASQDISTVLRVEGMDLEIGSRKLLKEACEAIDAAIATEQVQNCSLQLLIH